MSAGFNLLVVILFSSSILQHVAFDVVECNVLSKLRVESGLLTVFSDDHDVLSLLTHALLPPIDGVSSFLLPLPFDIHSTD